MRQSSVLNRIVKNLLPDNIDALLSEFNADIILDDAIFESTITKVEQEDEAVKRAKIVADDAAEIAQIIADRKKHICICNGSSRDRSWIACDHPKCPIEWYHFECLGICFSPKGKYICPFCRAAPRLRRL